jgi:hypothetical protein
MKKLKPGCLLRVKYPDEIIDDPSTAFWDSNNIDILSWEGFAIEGYEYDENIDEFINIGEKISIPAGTRNLFFVEEKRKNDWAEGVCYYKVLYGEKECWIYYEDVAEIVKE